jgi:hypothetical protein
VPTHESTHFATLESILYRNLGLKWRTWARDPTKIVTPDASPTPLTRAGGRESERTLVPIRGPDEDHRRSQQRHGDHDSADPDHPLWLGQPLGSEDRDKSLNGNTGERRDDCRGEHDAEVEVHERCSRATMRATALSYEGLDGGHLPAGIALMAGEAGDGACLMRGRPTPDQSTSIAARAPAETRVSRGARRAGSWHVDGIRPQVVHSGTTNSNGRLFVDSFILHIRRSKRADR